MAMERVSAFLKLLCVQVKVFVPYLSALEVCSQGATNPRLPYLTLPYLSPESSIATSQDHVFFENFSSNSFSNQWLLWTFSSTKFLVEVRLYICRKSFLLSSASILKQ